MSNILVDVKCVMLKFGYKVNLGICKICDEKCCAPLLDAFCGEISSTFIFEVLFRAFVDVYSCTRKIMYACNSVSDGFI